MIPIMIYEKKIKNYASSSLSGARPPGALGPPARLAIMIWSTFRIVHAACVAYCNPQNLDRYESKMPALLTSNNDDPLS